MCHGAQKFCSAPNAVCQPVPRAHSTGRVPVCHWHATQAASCILCQLLLAHRLAQCWHKRKLFLSVPDRIQGCVLCANSCPVPGHRKVRGREVCTSPSSQPWFATEEPWTVEMKPERRCSAAKRGDLWSTDNRGFNRQPTNRNHSSVVGEQ